MVGVLKYIWTYILDTILCVKDLTNYQWVSRFSLKYSDPSIILINFSKCVFLNVR